jgi:hypothetical protein
VAATLTGSVNPNGQATSYRFEYGRDTYYGSAVPMAYASAGSDSASHAVSQSISGLLPNTTYHYRVVATNASALVAGSDRTFTTAGAPSARTGQAQDVTFTGATLNGFVNPNRQPTTYRFEYGTTTGYGSSVPAPEAAVGSDSASHAVSQAVSGLTAGTTYHYRIVATNAANRTSAGADEVFKTTELPQLATSDSPPPQPTLSLSNAAWTPSNPGVVSLTLGCGGSAASNCDGTVTLSTTSRVSAKSAGRSRFLTLGSARFQLAAGSRKTVKIRLTPAAKRLVARLKRVRVRAIAVVHQGGQTVTSNQVFMLRARKA